MNSQAIFISVIIPVYNLEKVIIRCLQSLSSQTYKYFEIIAVDDGSIDHSLEICENYAATDNRVIVIHKENGGVSSARNLGIDVSRGEIVVFVDGDDFVLPTYLEHLVSGFKDNDIDIVVMRFASGDHEGLDYRACEDISISGRYNSVDFEKLQYTSRNVYEHGMAMCVWGKGYKKKVLDGVRFEGRYSEDYAFTDLVNSKGYTISVVDEIGYIYCYNPNSLVRNVNQIEKAVFLNILLKRLVYFSDDEFLVSNTCKLFCNMYIEYYYGVAEAERAQIKEYNKQFNYCINTLKSYHLRDDKFFIRMFLFRASPLLYKFITSIHRQS